MQQKLSYEELLQQNILQGQQLLQALSENKIILEQLAQYKNNYNTLEGKFLLQQHELSQLKRMIFGSKSERFEPQMPASQTSLDLNVEPDAVIEVTEQQVTYTRKQVDKKSNHKGRLQLPAHLPRIIHQLEPEENTEGLKYFGEDITEELEYTPGKFFVNQFRRKKYVKPGNEGVIMAKLPPRPIEKGIPGAGLLANIIVEKYVDHLPLHRQVQRFTREGINIAPATLTDWVKYTGNLMATLYDVLKQKVLQSDYLMADESPIKVLDNNKESGTHQGYYWVYRSPLEKLVLFEYRHGRGREGPTDMLRDFKGHLQTDGYAVYDAFGKQSGITLMSCMAHARRYFDQALINDKARAEYALSQFGLLYDVESETREHNYAYDKRYELRQKESVPVLQQMENWLKENYAQVLPKSPIGKAIAYSLERWKKLNVYTTDGKLEIDNNWVENCIRPLA
ncbi:MAG: IS66 family transposase, partial [Bacteroidia bacterium]